MVLQVRAHGLQQRPPGLLAHAEHLRRLADDQRRIADRRQVEEPDAVGEVVDLLRRGLQRQPGLAQSAHAEQGQQARSAEQALDLRQFALAADEGRRLVGQVVRDLVDRQPPVAHPDDAMRLLAVGRLHEARRPASPTSNSSIGSDTPLMLPVPVRDQLVRRSCRGLRGRRPTAASGRRAPGPSPGRRSAWPGLRPRAASRPGRRRRPRSRAGSPARRAGRRAPSAASAARPGRGGTPSRRRPRRRRCRTAAACRRSCRSRARARGRARSRETRSCAAQTSAIALSPSVSDRRVLSTTSVSSRALISLIAPSAEAAPGSGEVWAWQASGEPGACAGDRRRRSG